MMTKTAKDGELSIFSKIDLANEMILLAGPSVPLSDDNRLVSIQKILRPVSRWAAGQVARGQPNSNVVSRPRSMFTAPPELGMLFIAGTLANGQKVVLQWRVGAVPNAPVSNPNRPVAPDAKPMPVITTAVQNRNPGKLLSARALKSSTDVSVLSYGPFDNGPLLVGYDNVIEIWDTSPGMRVMQRVLVEPPGTPQGSPGISHASRPDLSTTENANDEKENRDSSNVDIAKLTKLTQKVNTSNQQVQNKEPLRVAVPRCYDDFYSQSNGFFCAAKGVVYHYVRKQPN